MPQAGVSARARRRNVSPWWEELDSEAFREFRRPPDRRAGRRRAAPLLPEQRVRPHAASAAVDAGRRARRPAAAGPCGISGRRTAIRGRRPVRASPARSRRHERAGLQARPDRDVGGAARRAADPGGRHERARRGRSPSARAPTCRSARLTQLAVGADPAFMPARIRGVGESAGARTTRRGRLECAQKCASPLVRLRPPNYTYQA